MRSGTPTHPPTPADEALDLALLAGVITLAALSVYLIWSGFDSPVAIGVIVTGALTALLLVIPHVTALWLSRDIDELLEIDNRYPE